MTDSNLKKMFPNTHFHTHPSIGHIRQYVENPSDKDIDFRNGQKSQFKNFIILYRADYHPFEVKTRNYTND